MADAHRPSYRYEAGDAFFTAAIVLIGVAVAFVGYAASKTGTTWPAGLLPTLLAVTVIPLLVFAGLYTFWIGSRLGILGVRPARDDNDTQLASVTWAVLLLLGTSMVGIGLLAWGTDVFQQYPYFLPVLIGLVAFTSMILTVLYGSRVARALGMDSPQHAFGMPPGSIRAILALGFMVLVLILGVFTITIVRDDSLIAVDRITPQSETVLAARDRLAGEYGSDYVAIAVPGAEPGTGYVEIKKLAGANQAVVQLSQQVLTMVATALTAIVGFYFGSRTANEPEATQKADRTRRVREFLERAGKRLKKLDDEVSAGGGPDAIRTAISETTEDPARTVYLDVLRRWEELRERLRRDIEVVENLLALPEIDLEYFFNRRAVVYSDLDRYAATWAAFDAARHDNKYPDKLVDP